MTSDQKQIWKALSDPTRRALLDMLRDGPTTTGTLCERFGMSRIGVIKHLNILRNGGLVLTRKRGRTSWNYLNAVPIQLIYERWVRRYESLWAENLVSLKESVEGKGIRRMRPEEARGFSIEQELMISAPRNRVWKALTGELEDWWKHRWFGDNSRITLEARIGGHFKEEAGEDAVLWGTVTFIKPGELLVLQGVVGMQRSATLSTYSYELEDAGEETRLKLSHVAFGTQEDAMEADHESGWKMEAESLKDWVERGIRWDESVG